MIVALTREPARSLDACELTYREREPFDAGVAAEQHRAYRKALRACGAEVVTLPRIDELPDSVFVEDTAIVLDELAVLTRPGVESRRAVDADEPWAANVLRVERTLCVGAAFPRTARKLAARGYDVRAVDCSEFAKAEGALTCMSLLFRQPSGAAVRRQRR